MELKIVIFLLFAVKSKADWDYHSDTYGPSHWDGICATGKKQSPIKISTTSTIYDQKLRPFTFTNYNKSNEYSTVLNNGHTIQVNMDDDSVGITGGGLVPGFYKLVQFHFHWGNSSDEGSEHWMDNEQYPMEMHLVHYNAMYPNLSSAVQVTDGLAVLGFFFEIQSKDNAALDFLLNDIINVSKKDSSDQLSTKPALMDMLKVVDPTKYVRYSGSLTTPGCYESVQWTVFTDKIPISEMQMNKIRNTYLDNGQTLIGHNYRPTQNLNGRNVSRSFNITTSSEWDYHSDTNGPSHWTGVCATGQKQSPIKIDISSTVYDNKLRSFNFTNYNASNEYSTVLNNGHTIQVNMDNDSVGITGGGLVPGFYKLVQFHFHWGNSSDEGSEHWIDNEQYPMELHLVHYNAMYPNLSSAVQATDGLAVLGFLFHIHEMDNADLDFLFDELINVSNKGAIDGLSTKPAIMNMLKVVDLTKYVRYSGSLTTPGCYESVQWTVFTETIPISEAQMNDIRNTYLDAGTTKIGHNYRPTQNLNDRTVTRSYSLPTTTISSTKTVTKGSASNSVTVSVQKSALLFLIFVPFIFRG